MIWHIPQKRKKYREEFNHDEKQKTGKRNCTCCCDTALAAGGTAAYLTDFETATNSFTVGKVDIDLDEPNWKPEDNTDLVPTQVIRKDPYVANKGVNEAFVYLEVSVPVRNVITVAKDGTRNALAKNRAVQLHQK